MYVLATAALRGFVGELGASEAAAFMQGVATAVGVHPASVRIINTTIIPAASAPQRLLLLAPGPGIAVAFVVKTTAGNGTAVLGAVRTAITLEVLQAAGLGACTGMTMLGTPIITATAPGAFVSPVYEAPADDIVTNVNFILGVNLGCCAAVVGIFILYRRCCVKPQPQRNTEPVGHHDDTSHAGSRPELVQSGFWPTAARRAAHSTSTRSVRLMAQPRGSTSARARVHPGRDGRSAAAGGCAASASFG